MQSPVAVFDFDKTLITRDSLLPLGLHLARKTRNLSGLFRFAAGFLMFKLGLISNKSLKQAFLAAFIEGRPLEALVALLEGFEKEVLRGIINEPVHGIFLDHLAKGHRVVVLSSNFDLVLKNLSMLAGADIVGTEVSFDPSRKTYRLEGPVYAGQAKIAKLEELFGDGIFAEAAFWGDAEDSLLLEKFRKSHLVA